MRGKRGGVWSPGCSDMHRTVRMQLGAHRSPPESDQRKRPPRRSRSGSGADGRRPGKDCPGAPARAAHPARGIRGRTPRRYSRPPLPGAHSRRTAFCPGTHTNNKSGGSG
eukprot:scaffold28116_cov110-Isochrysis_galbana.AAC.5